MPKPTYRHNQCVGIMADSHGRPEKIDGALRFFETHACDTIFHLGDICDSACPETADPCVRLLQRQGVHSIKGNNDHLIVVNYEGRQWAPVTPGTITYLKHLPLTRTLGNCLLAHSLPFEEERGLSSMIGVVDAGAAAHFFDQCPQALLFRGHSHFPEILRPADPELMPRALRPGQTVRMGNMLPAIVTCGALAKGFLMTWQPNRQTLTCHALEPTATCDGR